MNKPYTKEMWEQERKIAAKEYLLSNQKEDKKNRFQFWIDLIVIVILGLFLYYFPDILYSIQYKNKELNEQQIQYHLEEITTSLMDKKVLSSLDDTLYLADLYEGKYNMSISPIFSNTRYPYQCMGYITIKSGEIDVSHYCDMFE